MVEKDEAWIREVLREISDPEIPVLSIVDLGIIHSIYFTDEKITVDILPTYTGCPAMDMISMMIREKLFSVGFRNIEVNICRNPVWHTGLISEAGLKAIQAYGIAAPQKNTRIEDLLSGKSNLICPHCNSSETEIISPFGSTACKALMRCTTCLEPFEYFKCNAHPTSKETC